MEGAGFAFDTADMDFNNVYATMPQQQSFAKPNEDNTPGFFFGDEGIDTAASFIDPTVFSTPSQELSYMPQNLAVDNTVGNASMWNSELTPDSLIMNSFPATPTQSFEMYQPSFGTSLGKRPLQIDVEDFPQPKRHESAEDYTTMSSFSSSASLQMDVTAGLSDEAADVCATWFNKYAVLPSDRHIESLSQLTGESSTVIRQWFGRLLKQGMGGHDSAYKSQTDMIQPALCWSDSYTADIVPRQQPLLQQQPEQQLNQEDTAPLERRSSNDTASISQPAPTLRGGKKRCTPTDDRALLARDPNKIYQCTRKCGKRYGRKCDWKRNEEEGYPCKSWVCSLCTSEGVENVRPCFRKYHFVQHFRNIHPDVNSDEYEQSSIVCSETEFPRNCGFCKHRFDSRQDRIDHIADHFKQGKCMLDWSDDNDDDSHDSDNNDDDDDKSSGDGYDGAPSYPPPESDPRDNFGSKYYGGGGDYGGGSSSSESLLPEGSFFQFQSSGSEDVDITKQLQGDQQHIQQRPLSSSESNKQNSLQECIRTEPTTRDNQTTLAGDALSGLLVGRALGHSQRVGDGLVSSSKHGISLAGAFASSQLTLPVSREDATGQSTNVSTTEATTQQYSKDRGLSTSSVLDASAGHTRPTPLSSPATLDLLQTFTPQSFLSVRLLGAGGFSTVDEVLHRPTNLRLGRKTLKNRDQSAIEELKKEVSILQKLRHPHVIRFLGAYSKDDKMSILVSPVAETTLALWLEQANLRQPANLVNAINKMFGCLVSSIRYIHEQRPVLKHMDIKPQNILVTQGDQEFPHVVLCDFGISSTDLGDDQHKPLTRRYIAPEVFEGFAREQAADIWSLGCVFAEMASVSFGQSNSEWHTFRREYSGRTGKHYWQDVPSLQGWLSSFLEEAATPTEQLVVGTLRSMLDADPNARPSATLLSLRFTPAPCCLEWPNNKAVFPAPDQELEAVEMLVRKDGVGCCDRLDRAASVTDDRSRDVFKNAKCWMEECFHTHEACRQYATIDKHALPTRLVDVTPNGLDGLTIRIVEGASLVASSRQVEYIAVTHMWEQADITLTTDRLQNAQVDLQRKVLAKPLKSAIEAAQRLGHRYIWVDSLCVVQDSEDDKQSECVKMASVFRNAALTIVLDQVHGLRPEKPAIIEVIPGTVLPNANANSLAPNANRASDRLSASASLPVRDFVTAGFGWNTRAWALQERLLSHRFLHFCEKQLYWECNSLKASDTFPRGLSSLVWEKAHSKSRHNVLQRGIHGSQLATLADKLDSQTTLEPTRLRNCQWVHKEGDGNSDSMTAAHTTIQAEDAKAFFSSKATFAPRYARKNLEAAINRGTDSCHCSSRSHGHDEVVEEDGAIV